MECEYSSDAYNVRRLVGSINGLEIEHNPLAVPAMTPALGIGIGDDVTVDLLLEAAGGVPADLSGVTSVLAQLRRLPACTDVAATGTAAPVSPAATSGTIRVTFPAAQTAGLTPGDYAWDLLLTMADDSLVRVPPVGAGPLRAVVRQGVSRP